MSVDLRNADWEIYIPAAVLIPAPACKVVSRSPDGAQSEGRTDHDYDILDL